MAEINETNKEIILTESAVKQLIENIKSADSALQTTVTNNVLGSTTEILTFTPGVDANNEPIEVIDNIHLNGIANYIAGLDAELSGNSQYISSIQQTNGAITATFASAETTYIFPTVDSNLELQDSGNINSILPTSNAAITNAINSLTANYMCNAGEYINRVTQIDGRIFASEGRFNPSINIFADSATQKININVGNAVSPQVDLEKATTETYGIVKLSTSPTLDSNDVITSGAVYTALSDFAPCLSLNNEIVYLSPYPSTDSNHTTATNDGIQDYGENGSITTYNIAAETKVNNKYINLNNQSVIMVSPVFGDTPNEDLLYTKVELEEEENAENLYDEDINYYIASTSANNIKLNNLQLYEKGSNEPTQTWKDALEENKLWMKTESENEFSSWDIWANYAIICDQDKINLNKLNFYLNNKIPAPGLEEGVIYLDSAKRIKMAINLAIFNYTLVDSIEENEPNNQNSGEGGEDSGSSSGEGEEGSGSSEGGESSGESGNSESPGENENEFIPTRDFNSFTYTLNNEEKQNKTLEEAQQDGVCSLETNGNNWDLKVLKDCSFNVSKDINTNIFMIGGGSSGGGADLIASRGTKIDEFTHATIDYSNNTSTTDYRTRYFLFGKEIGGYGGTGGETNINNYSLLENNQLNIQIGEGGNQNDLNGQNTILKIYNNNEIIANVTANGGILKNNSDITGVIGEGGNRQEQEGSINGVYVYSDPERKQIIQTYFEWNTFYVKSITSNMEGHSGILYHNHYYGAGGGGGGSNYFMPWSQITGHLPTDNSYYYWYNATYGHGGNYDEILQRSIGGDGGVYNINTTDPELIHLPTAGLPNTGSGGGGGCTWSNDQGNKVGPGEGGSGIVIISNYE